MINFKKLITFQYLVGKLDEEYEIEKFKGGGLKKINYLMCGRSDNNMKFTNM